MTLRETEHAGQSPVDDHYRNAGGGIAQSTTGDQLAYGDPEPIDRTIEESRTSHAVSGHDGGQPNSESHTSSAAVTPFDPAIVEPSSIRAMPDRGAARTLPAKAKSTRGGSNLSEPANVPLTSVERPQAQGDGQNEHENQTSFAVAALSDLAIQELQTSDVREIGGGGLGSSDDQSGYAPAKKTRKAKHVAKTDADVPTGGDGQTTSGNQSIPAVAVIVDLWRQRVDLKRAAARLNLQALAVRRRANDGDKEAAQKAWGLIQKGRGDEDLAMVLEPYRQAMAGLEHSAAQLEKQLAKLVRKQSIWAWAEKVRGLGELSVAGLIGEASGNPGDYRSVSALWKRFGLAVIEGERQRRVAGAEQALIHGYAPQRRAFAYVISCNLMKSQKADDEYRQLYDRRKAYELEREIPKAHAHNRALRVMVKELLKDAWAADRRLRGA